MANLKRSGQTKKQNIFNIVLRMCSLLDTKAAVYCRANAFSCHLKLHTTEKRNISEDKKEALIPVGCSLVLCFFWFSLFCSLQLHI